MQHRVGSRIEGVLEVRDLATVDDVQEDVVEGREREDAEQEHLDAEDDELERSPFAKPARHPDPSPSGTRRKTSTSSSSNTFVQLGLRARRTRNAARRSG